jgi:prepilin-type N-terminal cleavage/methylation domain-containing protein
MAKHSSKKPAFTLLELLIAVSLFALAITLSFLQSVGTANITKRTDVRTAVSDSGRAVKDAVDRAMVGAKKAQVELLSPARIQVKSLDTGVYRDTCQVIGRANAVVGSGGQEVLNADDNGSTIAFWVYQLNPDNGQCTSTLQYAGRLLAEDVNAEALLFTKRAVDKTNCGPGLCSDVEQYRYQIKVISTVKLSGRDSATTQPSVEIVGSLPLGLIE